MAKRDAKKIRRNRKQEEVSFITGFDKFHKMNVSIIEAIRDNSLLKINGRLYVGKRWVGVYGKV